MSQFGTEGFALFRRAEVTLPIAPSCDRFNHAADELAHRPFTLHRGGMPLPILDADRSPKVFGYDDIGRGLRPRAWHLHLPLFEHHASVFAGDDRSAQLPVDFVHGVATGTGEEPLELKGRLRITRPAICVFQCHVVQVRCSPSHRPTSPGLLPRYLNAALSSAYRPIVDIPQERPFSRPKGANMLAGRGGCQAS